MTSQFVEMYHPDIPGTFEDPVLVALQAVDNQAANGWLLIDGGPLPDPVTPYYTKAASDSRFAKLDDLDDPESFTGSTLAAVFAPKADPTFTGTVGLPGGASGNPRLPVNGAAVVDGSTLPAGTSDKVAYALSAVFRGDFTAEVGYGGATPTFVFGHNLFTVTGDDAGDMAGINDFYGTLAENHLYAPGADLVKQYGFQAETAIESTAVGSTVDDLMTGYFKGPAVNGGTADQVVTLRFDQPETSGSGVITGLTLGLWGRGAALFEGPPSPLGQTARKGVWVGGGQASGSDPGVELATGTQSWRIDHVAGVLRFAQTDVDVKATLDFSGNLGIDGVLTSGGAAVSGAAKFTGPTAANAQGAAVGVYVGSVDGSPGLNIADGTNTWGIDLSAGNLRFMKAATHEAFSFTLDGDLKTRRGVGFFNTAPITSKRTSSANATDLATALTLVNEIKADLQAIGVKA